MTGPPPTGVAPDQFRHLLGAFPTGVTVLTIDGEDGAPIAMTVSSVAAVSLDPPLLLACVHQDARAHDRLLRGTAFVLNVLSEGQRDLSLAFSEGASLGDISHDIDPLGPVRINGASAHIACTVWDSVPAGDHTVFFGLVLGGAVSPRSPLVHHGGSYTSTRMISHPPRE